MENILLTRPLPVIQIYGHDSAQPYWHRLLFACPFTVRVNRVITARTECEAFVNLLKISWALLSQAQFAVTATANIDSALGEILLCDAPCVCVCHCQAGFYHPYH